MALKQINTDNQELELVQDNVAEALTPLQNVPMVGGNMLQGVSLVAGQDNLIRHGLDHAPFFFIVSNIKLNSNIWSPASSAIANKSSNPTYINLWCSNNCTISVWVN